MNVYKPHPPFLPALPSSTPLPPSQFFYAPNFVEVEGAYCFGPQSVCPLHLLLVVKLENPLSLQEIEILYVASVQKISKHIFFFAVRPSLAKLCPLCRFCAIKAVAPLPLPLPHFFFDLDYTTCSTMCRWLLICIVPHLNVWHTALVSTSQHTHTPPPFPCHKKIDLDSSSKFTY